MSIIFTKEDPKTHSSLHSLIHIARANLFLLVRIILFKLLLDA